MGTPDFALPSLRALLDRGFEVRAVVTQPDRRVGRGRKLAPPPVKALALERGLPVLQPTTLRDKEVQGQILSFGAECLVVVAYGQLVPVVLLDGHPLGGINVHPSLLPRYRGAAPIQRPLRAGDTETGVSIMQMEAGLDTGPVLLQRSLPIAPEDTAGSMHDKLAELGAEMLCETLKRCVSGDLKPAVQDDAGASYAPPIEKGELQIDWSQPASDIVNLIRAFDPGPGAYTFYEGKRMKCYRPMLLPWRSEEQRGGVVTGESDGALVVLGGDGRAVAVRDLQMQGQRRMKASNFLRGHPIPIGTQLG